MQAQIREAAYWIKTVLTAMKKEKSARSVLCFNCSLHGF